MNDKVYQRNYYQKNKKRIQAYQRQQYRDKILTNPERLAAYKKASASRSRRLKYGITKKEYEDLLTRWGNKCHICDDMSQRPLNVDHDHITGKIRGLLCWSCNKGLGFFKDNPESLTKAAEYIRRL